MSFLDHLTKIEKTEMITEKVVVSEKVFDKIEELLDTNSAESKLRKAGLKIKSVHGTKFGTQIDFAKQYEEDAVKKILKDYTLKFDGKSVFVID